LWDTATQSQQGVTMTAGTAVTAVSFSADGTTLAVAGSGRTTGLWSVATQKPTGAVLAAPGSAAVSTVAFGAGLLATGRGDGTIDLWDPDRFHQSAAPVATGAVKLSGHASAVFSARGDVLAVSEGRGVRGRIRVQNALTGRSAGPAIATGQAVTGLAFNPDGTTLAVSGGGLQLWSTATGQRTGAALPGAGTAGPAAFSPDGTRLAAVGADGQARVWNVATQRQTGTVVNVGHPEALAFGSGGTKLATAGADGRIQLWDVATEQEIGAPMTAGSAPVYALAFSPDGRTLATVSSGATRRWDVAFPASLTAAACTLAGQTLTPRQWASYAGTEPFQQVCPAS
jgi:WD40 repeat protein